jgi:putative hemolysin
MEWLIIIILLFFNGAFSCMEMAFASTNVPLLRNMADKGNLAAKIFLNLKARPERTFAVIQTGITLIGILSATVGGTKVETTIHPFLIKFLSVSDAIAEMLGIAFFVIPFTFFTVVVGELIPKAIAIRYPEEISLVSSRLLVIMTKIAAPLVHILERATIKILSLAGFRTNISSNGAVSELPLESLHPLHREYILNLFGLRFKKASEVVLPFSKVVTISNSMSKQEILRVIIACGHTRLPVVSSETTLQVIGILHSKEFVAMMDTHTEFSLASLLREPYFVNMNESILKILKNFQVNKIHMAVVSQGEQIMGIITLEDILEEVVGEIYDEDDDGIVKKIWSQRIGTSMYQVKK